VPGRSGCVIGADVLATSDARVIIFTPGADPTIPLASSDAADAAEAYAGLVEGLARLGWPGVVVRDLDAAIELIRTSPVQAVVMDARRHPNGALQAADRLRRALHPRQTPILGLGAAVHGAELLDRFDLAMGGEIHPAQAAMRLDQLVRAAVAEEELALRSETFANRLMSPLRATMSQEPLQVLTVGEPAPKFLALNHDLRLHGVETTGAFTAYTAFDYLHEKRFDAVILWSGETHAEALSIAGGMRRNTRLFHIPTILAVRPGVEIAAADAYHRGLSDVVSAHTPAPETALRVVAMARRYRRETAIRDALDLSRFGGLMESATGLFTRDLFAAHLARLAAAAGARRRPLTVAVLRIADRPDAVRARARGWLDRAVPQIGSMIGRLVRAEDTAARLASDVFALALPAATAAAGRITAERIAAVIACTAFEADDETPPFAVDFDIGVAQLEPGESAAHALERAANGALSRAVG
jgi:two-component system, cell cycle response regulator PopA